jgi:hypothetical protein
MPEMHGVTRCIPPSPCRKSPEPPSIILSLLKDWQHEGRALTRAILQSSGNLRMTDTELHVTLVPLASPYKTRALAALCEELTRLASTFPGTNLKMVFHVQ